MIHVNFKFLPNSGGVSPRPAVAGPEPTYIDAGDYNRPQVPHVGEEVWIYKNNGSLLGLVRKVRHIVTTGGEKIATVWLNQIHE